jgi:riboflavin biosynthesis pyrimidine reductase
MGAQPDAEPRNERPDPPSEFRRLVPVDGPATAAEIVDGLGLRDPGAAARERPYVMLNMVSTVDGHATLAGRSGPLGGRADRELFHELRAAVDAVAAGAGTIRTERYGRIIPQPARRRLRRERGLSEEPLACIVSDSLSLSPDIPLLADSSSRVVILTSSQARLPQTAAHVDYVREEREGRLDLASALGVLRGRFAVRTLLCEGGPHLNGRLLAAGLVDELFLSMSPKLVSGEAMQSDPALRILAGPELKPPVELELMGALQSDSYLFLRYGVRASAPERVSRETISNSSLAS